MSMFLFILAVLLVVVAIGAAVTFLVSGYSETKRGAAVVGVIAILVAVAFIGLSSIRQVPAASVGIPVAFGDVKPAVGPGVHFMAPWTDVNTFNTRTQELTFGVEQQESIISTQAKGGGNIDVEMTVQYRVIEGEADELFEDIGTDFERVVLIPSARECPRDVIPNYTPEEVFGPKRAQVATETRECLRQDEELSNIEIQDVKIREVDPGEQVKAAIDDKVAAEQGRQQATVDLETERIKAESREQRGRNITPELVEIERLEVLRELARSENNTVYVVPDGTDVTAFASPQGGGNGG